MTLNPIWPPPKRAKMENKYYCGIIELKKVIFLSNSMFLSMIYSLVHLKCTQNSHDLESTPKTQNQDQVWPWYHWAQKGDLGA